MDNNKFPVPAPDALGNNLSQLKRSNGISLPATYPPMHRPYRDETDVLFSPRFLIKALLHWWWIAMPAALLLAVASSSLIWVFFKPMYRTSAVIRIADHRPFLAYDTHRTAEQSEEFIQTQIELLRSSLVLGPVLSRPEIARLSEVLAMQEPIDSLAQRVGVQQIGHSELYQVSYEGFDPNASALIANAVVDEYFNLRTQDDASHTQRVIELLEQEKTRRATQVHGLREEMRQLAEKVLGKDPFIEDATARSTIRNRPLEELAQKLTVTEVESKVLEAQIKALEEATTSEEVAPVPELMIEMALEEDQEIRDLKALIASKRAMLNRIELVAARGKNDPSYQRIAKEIAQYEQSLKRSVATARPRVAERVQEMAKLQRKDDLAQMRSKLEVQSLMEQLLRERYKKQLDEAGSSGNQSLELEFTRTELAREEKVFEMIAQRAMELQTELRAPGQVTLMKRASIPKKPVEEIPLKNLALALFGSFCLPFGIAILWEHSIRRVSDSEQLQKQAELSVLAEIAKLPLRAKASGNGLSRSGRELGLFEESIDSLRTCLVLPDDHRSFKVLAVASAVHGEGKTSVVSQLAVSLARACGEPTLLIDADMRAPDIHRIFQIPCEPGLAKVLDHRCTIQEAIDTSWSELVHLLPAGKLHKSPHKLLGGGAFDALLNELRGSYRYIVIDTPPILSASESLVVAKHSDATIICAMRDRTREAQIRRAYERLVASGARPVGVVLNAVPTKRYASTYGDYSYSREVE